MRRYSREAVAALIDHTLLKPEATESDIASLVDEAAQLDVYAVCVSPPMVSAAAASRTGDIRIASVVGFPSGKHLSAVKAEETRLAVRAGAEEIDMVIDIGDALSGRYNDVSADIEAVRDVAESAVLKVIVESAALLGLGGGQTLIDLCRIAEDAGADFVKTSTGFHPAGGATVRAVEIMAATVAPRLGVKASGGIRTGADAIAMLDAGATRLGLSGSRAVLDGLG